VESGWLIATASCLTSSGRINFYKPGLAPGFFLMPTAFWRGLSAIVRWPICERRATALSNFDNLDAFGRLRARHGRHRTYYTLR
jgi:hypothetical protein